MKCPQCDNDFPMTWKRYIKAPLGRIFCPSCHAKLVTTHRWLYWPLMILSCCILGIPLAILGANYGVAGVMTGWFIGALSVGIPFDRFLETRFSVLRMRQDGTSNKPTGDWAERYEPFQKRRADMKASIHPIKLGVDHCYIIRGERFIMIDGGAPKQVKNFMKAVERLSIKPEDIKLIVLTHGHWDHIGSAKEIKDLTGAKLALHQKEKDWLEKSLKPLPPGVTAWGKIFVKILAMFMPLVHIPVTDVDIVLGDGEFPLSEYGIPGKILYTPGHSMGSVSILLDTGDAFVGDLAMSEFPLRFSPGLPILAEDMQKVRESWRLLMDRGAETIYPAHGKPFSVDIIRKAFS